MRQTVAAMYIAPVDATLGEDEWRPFVESHPFGHLVAPGGRDRDVAVVVPTQFVLEGDTVWLHLVRANPVFAALAENPRVLLSVAGDWAFIPSSWKAIGDEDPALGIPTTYYGAVQLTGTATVHDERTDAGQRGRHPAAPAGGVPARRRRGRPGRGARGRSSARILGICIAVEEVRRKFKYGGNVDEAHRLAVVERLARARDGPGDEPRPRARGAAAGAS